MSSSLSSQEKFNKELDPSLAFRTSSKTAMVQGVGGFINPEMSATRDEEGNITGVEVTYPDDFTGQMLRYSEQFSFLPDVN